MGKCIKCGTNFVGTPENPPSDALCKYCEIEQLKADNTRLRNALVGMVGAESKEELAQMEEALRGVVPGVEHHDKISALNAIHALQESNQEPSGSEYDAGMGTTPGMWEMLSGVLAEEHEKLPDSINRAIYALRDGQAKVTPKIPL